MRHADSIITYGLMGVTLAAEICGVVIYLATTWPAWTWAMMMGVFFAGIFSFEAWRQRQGER